MTTGDGVQATGSGAPATQASLAAQPCRTRAVARAGMRGKRAFRSVRTACLPERRASRTFFVPCHSRDPRMRGKRAFSVGPEPPRQMPISVPISAQAPRRSFCVLVNTSHPPRHRRGVRHAADGEPCGRGIRWQAGVVALARPARQERCGTRVARQGPIAAAPELNEKRTRSPALAESGRAMRRRRAFP